MNNGEDVERVAILLHALGASASTSVMSQLSSDQAKTMKTSLAEIERIPPSPDEIDEILDEFHRVLRVAVGNEVPSPTDDPAVDSAAEAAGNAGRGFTSSGDPFDDLERLEDFQIAGALRGESTASIVVLLNCLPAERTGGIIQQLPEDRRSEVFLGLSEPPNVSAELVARIAQTIVSKGCELDENSVADPQLLADEKLATMLRSMDRSNRQSMIQSFEVANQERAERIKAMLYMFEDLLRITDRSIQKLLGEIDSSTLSVALKNATEDIVEKVVSNLSKRARSALLEEIEYLGSVSPDDQEKAEKEVCDAMSRLDQAGSLEMEE